MKNGAGQLRDLSLSELGTKKDALNKELFELRQKKASGQLEKPHHFKMIRRQIAQINTITEEKKHDSAKSGK